MIVNLSITVHDGALLTGKNPQNILNANIAILGTVRSFATAGTSSSQPMLVPSQHSVPSKYSLGETSLHGFLPASF
jgi:hypothetical protein